MASAETPRPKRSAVCTAVTFSGEVRAGEAFRRQFAAGQEFFLEPLASGWIVRVLEMRGGREVRESHDWAEVATPPYRSVSPLLISTDWAFRAQDAGAWNPREFRYAANRKVFEQMAGLEGRVVKNDNSAIGALSSLVVAQPEARLELTNVELVPGVADQAQMAATVASHWEATPHEVVQGAAAGTPLGKLMAIRFKVRMVLPAGVEILPGMTSERFSCSLRPTL
ncbi:MAG: hypothetical protein PW792_10865 [Acidobacteriaceae bacterium]|nr:hypothetical protein [Acidobacteriaceae bacterium]